MTQSVIRKYRLDELKPGMIVGKEIMSETGRLLVSPGTVLDDYLIRRLENLGVWQAEIIELLEANYVPQEEQAPAMDVSQLNQLFVQTDQVENSEQQAFSHEYNDMLKRLKTCFTSIRLENELNMDQIMDVTEEILTLSFRGPALVNHLHLTRRQDDYLIHHSVDVALLAGFIGASLGDLTLQQELVLTGLLHDIGKISIPIHVLNKVGQLSDEEFEMVRGHPAWAYKFLKNIKEISPSVLYGVLQHHERIDGSGYPFKAKGDKTHPFGKIIGLADVYSAMTSVKAYGQTHSPFLAADAIKKEMYAGKFDPSICNPFISHLYDSLIGSWVMLSDGREVQVIFWNDSTKGKFLFKTKEGEVFDLSKHPGLQITRLVDVRKE